MNPQTWAKLESLFDRFSIKPIVAVVPDNLDPTLILAASDPNFWNRVRSWEEKGWSIAMHGYQHTFHHVDRRGLVLPFYDRSEFAGLSLNEQSEKIRSSWAIFQRERITPDIWIAPAHCFDQTTLAAIKKQTSIRIISDGIAMDQYTEFGFFWLPQQLWNFVEKPSGLWTICLHPNSMRDADINHLEAIFSNKENLLRFVSSADVKMLKRKRNIKDKLLALRFWTRHNST